MYPVFVTGTEYSIHEVIGKSRFRRRKKNLRPTTQTQDQLDSIFVLSPDELDDKALKIVFGGRKKY